MTTVWPAVWRTMRRTLWLAFANLTISLVTPRRRACNGVPMTFGRPR